MIVNAENYTYELPEERIARYPLPERDSSKLLIYRNNEIGESVFRNIGQYLPSNATLVFNDTKVIRARLRFQKETGALIEVFCLEPIEPVDVALAFAQHNSTTWKCIVGNSKRWKSGDLTAEINATNGSTTLHVTRLKQEDQTNEIRFSWDNERLSFADIIESLGEIPIPPYLNRKTEEIDKERYQTVYSEHKGSVAAPTAGLHFTDKILSDLKNDGHKMLKVTLHVGAGTFKPMKTDEVEEHVMHTEHIVVTRDVITNLRDKREPIVAVGTTSVRTLESLYWLGVKLLEKQSIEGGLLQWEAYKLPQSYTLHDSMQALLQYLDDNQTDLLHNQTQIMIVPGYQLRVVDAIITNFHQPHSTLLLLVAAVVGDDWHKIYDYALQHDFRFLSYGDSSILYKKI
ncbi:MAG: S-adenosylmethionine:tRNA ribosyltransferase-isomerase [Bacteroidales bacterium]|nr:S-adenosylmethionine:tRNA ribosyltransferase-isomerase [Bacteroidales bacterium]